MDKWPLRVSFLVDVEERYWEPWHKRWHAQFSCYPLGYFRGKASTPAAALAIAWRKFRRQVDPRRRWWAPAFGAAPPTVRY